MRAAKVSERDFILPEKKAGWVWFSLGPMRDWLVPSMSEVRRAYGVRWLTWSKPAMVVAGGVAGVDRAEAVRSETRRSRSSERRASLPAVAKKSGLGPVRAKMAWPEAF